MSHLTVTEKEHWKKRIENRIDKVIEVLETKDASLMPKLKAKAEAEVYVSLGVADLHSKIQAIKDKRTAIDAEQEKLELSMHTKVLGESAVKHFHTYATQTEFSKVVSKRRQAIESELLKDSEIGREILKLRHEKDSLLDTVWLATSNSQIRDLWIRVSVVLGDDATPLQQQVMATEPASS